MSSVALVLVPNRRLLRRIQHTRRRHILRSMNTVALLNDASFKEHFRMSRTSFQKLFVKLGPFLKQGQTSYAISIETKLLVTLRFLAQGSYQLGVGNDLCLGVSKPSVSFILREVLTVMNNILCEEFITLPTVEDMKQTCSWALAKYRIPGIIGMIDGTHISIVAPKNDEAFPEFVYVNRKNFHSLNTQIICDHNYKIWNVNARFPGSTHDSYIWKRSTIRQYLLDNFINDKVWLLGDSGYPLEPILMVPFRNPQSEGAILFNEMHSKCRSAAERCIGVLKARWRCLKLERGLHYHPSIASRIINACVALHNFCISEDRDYCNILIEPDDDFPTEPAPLNGTLYEQGSTIRETLIGYLLQRT